LIKQTGYFLVTSLRRFDRQKYGSCISKTFVSFLSLWTPIYNDFCPLPRQVESTPAIRGHFQQYPDERTTQAAAFRQPRRRFWPFAFLDRARSGGNLLDKRFMNPSAMAARYLFHHRVRTRDAQKKCGSGMYTRAIFKERDLKKEAPLSFLASNQSFPAPQVCPPTAGR